jgi:hypothetical protein
VYMWNHLPLIDSSIAPVGSFTGATFDDFDHIPKTRV